MPTQVVLQQEPNLVFDQAYGPNPITISGISSFEDKYVLRVFQSGQATPIADIRQTPNQYGRAIFDLQNILQSHISPPAKDLDSIGVGAGSANSMRNTAVGSYTYTLQIGYEVNSVVTMMPQSYGPYHIFGGAKPYYAVPYDTTQYQSRVAPNITTPTCTDVTRVGKALTDVVWYTAPASTGDNIQSVCTITTDIATRNVYRDDLTTVTWFQELQRVGSINSKVRGIEAFRFFFVNASGSIISNQVIPNTVTYGGGPNGSIGDGFGISNPLKAVTLATGPANLPGAMTVPALATHYYVVPVAWTPNGSPCTTDPQSQSDLMDENLMQAQRFNILDEKCNDFEHFQFSWLNSLGFKDYFTFTKRVDHQTNTSRNNFLKEAADYNGQLWNVEQIDRGYTTYSQKIEDIYTVTSDFMNDDQAKLLQTLFQSPQVNVRMADEPFVWKPINILSATYDQQTNRKNSLFQYTIRFKIAHNIKSQRG